VKTAAVLAIRVLVMGVPFLGATGVAGREKDSSPPSKEPQWK
jgi:hypothetical protein